MQLDRLINFLKEKGILEGVVQNKDGKWVEHHPFQPCEIQAIESPELATKEHITFLEKEKYASSVLTTKAAAVILRRAYLKYLPKESLGILTSNPYLAFAYLTHFFAKPLFGNSKEPILGEGVQIAENAVIGKGSVIGEGCVIMAGVVIGENVQIGKNCVIYPNVCIYNDCEIGGNVRIHANSVIGSDGFGYAHTQNGEHIKIYHNGKVVLEEEVEIGSNTSIDRAVFGETRIKKGVKIDNLVQIGHNCCIGEYSIIVSQAGLSGSTTTGRNVVLGGQSGSAGHLHIGEFTQIGARGAISKSLPAFGKFSGHPLLPIQEWLKLQAFLKKMIKRS
ncbi:UDP-3-O-(3-hydroxymyristoyl)glucosamine N-acyltransferase [Helicobacter mesocricetorum]|uniref:UDP-3-O-(3-hydroxymyristoyl)glucosamine N-acyltransferase n=1 Tax=Helicobacter mesocricetorum TaxID=87012 RepID=UPI000CF0573F|nr:UDP-3-O-(3-hydroxymyristoyl)glucosamine N-acyltransferase [Helicobacter mesocricetorum]